MRSLQDTRWELTDVVDRTFTEGGRTTVRQQASAEYELGEHPDFMYKEMREQPDAVDRCLRGRLDHRFSSARLDGVGLSPQDYQRIRRVKLLGCGSAYYAGQLGAQLIEELARIPADAEPASPADVAAAASRLREAQREWAATPPPTRGSSLPASARAATSCP